MTGSRSTLQLGRNTKITGKLGWQRLADRFQLHGLGMYGPTWLFYHQRENSRIEAMVQCTERKDVVCIILFIVEVVFVAI
jgi:hypothetical protein